MAEEALYSRGTMARGAAARVSAWLLRTLGAERARWPLWYPVAFGAGIAIYFQLPMEPAGWPVAAVLGLTLLSALLLRTHGGAFALALLLLAAVAGFATVQLRTWAVAAPVLEREIGPVMVSGQLVSSEPHESGWRVVIKPTEFGDLPEEALPERIRINLAGSLVATPQALDPGRPVRVLAVLRPPPAPSAPGAFDFARMAYFQRLGGVGYGVGQLASLSSPIEMGPVEVWNAVWDKLRRAVFSRVRTAVPGEEGAVAAALLTGERGAIP